MYRYLFFLASILLMTGIVLAQSSSSNGADLLDMLSFVPDTPDACLASLHYVNYGGWFAVMAERSPISDTESLIDCLRQKECPYLPIVLGTQPMLSFREFDLRAFIANRVFPDAECVRDSATFSIVCDTPPAFEVMPEIMGFSPFDITHSLQVRSFTLPPLLVLRGDFDVEAIDTAYTARGWVTFECSPEGVVTQWCGPEGCNGGSAGQDTADLFGGNIGEMRPLAAVSNHLVSSQVLEGINMMLAGYFEDEPNLADAPDMQAAAAALDSIPGTLIQANVNGSSESLSLSLEPAVAELAASGETVTAETLKALAAPFALWREIPVPPYNMMVLADYMNPGERLTVIALVFDNVETATSASERIPKLMAAYTSFSFKQPVLNSIGALVDSMETEIYTDASTGKAVLLLKWRMTPPEEGGVQEQIYLSGGLFPLMLHFMQNNDLGWLASNVILPE